MFSFDKNKVNFDQEMGKGRFGSVYAYQKDSEDERWVVKIMTTKRIQEFIELHIKEIVLGFSFDHPNVLPVKGFYIDYDNDDESWYTYLKLPRMVCSLKEKIHQKSLKNNYFLEEEIVKYFYDLTCGLQYLHSRGVAHRNIKPSNILVDKNDQIKIGDIGIGEFIEGETSKTLDNFHGTHQYSAPEILSENQHLKKKDLFRADIWSIGIVLTELCLLELNIFNAREVSEKTETELVDKLQEVGGKRYNQVLIELISSLLKYDPSQRSSLLDITTVLEKNYPSILKKLTKEAQPSLDTEIIEKFDKQQTQVNFASIQKEIEEVKIEEPTLRKQEIDFPDSTNSLYMDDETVATIDYMYVKCQKEEAISSDYFGNYSQTNDSENGTPGKQKSIQLKRNVPGLIGAQTKKSLEAFLEGENSEKYQYLLDIFRYYDFSAEFIRGFITFLKENYKTTRKTWNGVKENFVGQEDYQKLFGLCVASFLSDAGRADFNDWLENGKMKNSRQILLQYKEEFKNEFLNRFVC